jgi:hypothetical protein
MRELIASVIPAARCVENLREAVSPRDRARYREPVAVSDRAHFGR